MTSRRDHPRELPQTLPHDPEVERALLGSVLIDPGQLHVLRPVLHCFASGRHRRIAEAMVAIAAGNSPIDILTLKAELERCDHLGFIGGPAYLADLLSCVPRSCNAEHYAARLRRLTWRRNIAVRAAGLLDAACDGAPDRDVVELVEGLNEERPPGRRGLEAVSLYAPDVSPTYPRWRVANLIPQAGVVLVWAPPGGGKTYLLLRLSHELLVGVERLFGHAELRIVERSHRVLWVCTEEDAGRLRARADMVLRGLGNPQLDGEILHLFAAAPGRSLTLDDLPEILDLHRPVDVVILDSLTGLRPKVVDGHHVKWDLDNDAANQYCLMLRGLVVKHELTMILVHHTGREVAKGYRGPTDWWASADVMFGLEPERLTSTIRVKPEKCRDGRLLPPWRLRPSWGPQGYNIQFEGEVVVDPSKLPGKAAEVAEFLRLRRRCTQAVVLASLPGSRSALQDAIKRAVTVGAARWTGETDGRSPVLAFVDRSGAQEPEVTAGREGDDE